MSRGMKPLTRLLVATVLAVGSGCAGPDWIEQTLVTVDVTGMWQGSYATSLSSGDIVLTLRQSGSKVTGQIALSAPTSAGRIGGPIEGTIGGDTFRFRDTRGRMAAELQVNVDEMTGSVLGSSGRALIQLRRQP